MLKSAYEIAMEKTGAPENLTKKQKEALAEIESKYRARIAEIELQMTPQIEGARGVGDGEAVSTLVRMLADERQKLQTACDEEKEKSRGKGTGKGERGK